MEVGRATPGRLEHPAELNRVMNGQMGGFDAMPCHPTYSGCLSQPDMHESRQVFQIRPEFVSFPLLLPQHFNFSLGEHPRPAVVRLRWLWRLFTCHYTRSGPAGGAASRAAIAHSTRQDHHTASGRIFPAAPSVKRTLAVPHKKCPGTCIFADSRT